MSECGYDENIVVLIYRGYYRGEQVFVETRAHDALARIPTNSDGWSIEVTTDISSWIIWPSEKVTRPRPIEEVLAA